MIKFDGATLIATMKETTELLVLAVGQGPMRASGFAGAEVFRDEAKANALKNKKTGTIYNNIIVKRLEEEASDRRQAYIVTVRAGKFNTEGDAYYWRFVENGHSFVRRNSKQGKGANWKALRAASALEYGTASAPAYPFMRPAYESKKQQAIEAMQVKLAEKIKEKLGG